jgi:hypothetical protein
MKAKIPIVVSLRGGLGNQLFQIAACLDICHDSAFEVEWCVGKPRLSLQGVPEVTSFKLPTEVVFMKKKSFSWLMSKSTGYLLRMGIFPRNYEKIYFVKRLIIALAKFISLVYFKEKRKTIILDELGFVDFELPSNRLFLVGYFQSFRWAYNPLTFNKLKQIELKHESTIVEKYKQLALKERPLVVHIRLGDYKIERDFGVLHPQYYIDNIEKLWQKGGFGKIWVFSDEIELAEKYFHLSDKTNFRFVPEIDGSASFTLEVMRSGFGYIIGNSTFSWWAAFLSYAESPLVIAPDPWFKNIDSPRDLLPPTWIKAKSIWSNEQVMDPGNNL